MDFSCAEGDLIDLTDYGLNGFNELQIADVSGDAVITLDNDSSITLAGIDANSLDSGDFLL
jgi:hypothetical protein